MIVYYDTCGEMLNTEEVLRWRNRALRKGEPYLLKIRFKDNSLEDGTTFIIEQVHAAEDAALELKGVFNRMSNVAWCAAFKMHGSTNNGRKQYEYMTLI